MKHRTVAFLRERKKIEGVWMIDYNGSRWKKKREKILRRDKYIDQWAKRYGQTLEANTVHHIYPVKFYQEYKWCDWNLISVNAKTHNKLENRKTGELTKYGIELIERTIPPPS